MKKEQKICYYCTSIEEVNMAIEKLKTFCPLANIQINRRNFNVWWYVYDGNYITYAINQPKGYSLAYFSDNAHLYSCHNNVTNCKKPACGGCEFWYPDNAPELDLTKILKEKDEVYSTTEGVGIVSQMNILPQSPIIVKFCDKPFRSWSFTKEGKFGGNVNGECVLFPSKTQRDWSRFLRCPFEKGELIAVSMSKNPNTTDIYLRHFEYIKNDFYYCSVGITDNWKYAWKLTELPIPLKLKE